MPIIFNPEGMVEEAKKNPVTMIGKEVCAAHIIKVWEAISAFTIQQLCHGRGVRIPGLAVITFKVMAFDLSQREAMVQKVPHILLLSELAVRHALKVKRPAYNLDVPEVELNLSVIAKITNMSRAHVEICVNEVISAYNRAIMCDPQVEFWIPKIGRIVIQCSEVDVVYCTEFLNLLGYSTEVIQDKICPLR